MIRRRALLAGQTTHAHSIPSAAIPRSILRSEPSPHGRSIRYPAAGTVPFSTPFGLSLGFSFFCLFWLWGSLEILEGSGGQVKSSQVPMVVGLCDCVVIIFCFSKISAAGGTSGMGYFENLLFQYYSAVQQDDKMMMT